MKNLYNRAMKWTPDPTQNPIRKLARRAHKNDRYTLYRALIKARLTRESDNAMQVSSMMALFDQVYQSQSDWRTLKTAPKKPETKVKRLRREWREAV